MGKQPQLHPQTRENLLRAMRREAFAFARYLLYATQARQHGRQEESRIVLGHAQADEAGLLGTAQAHQRLVR